jgi:hypothetical protein
MCACVLLGEPYFEKEEKPKNYPHYHRSPKQRLRRYKPKKSSKFSDLNKSTPKTVPQEYNPIHSKRRTKRQLDFDPTAKHVEVLVAYDESIKEFHTGADIKSYILTLFSYVSFLTKTNQISQVDI